MRFRCLSLSLLLLLSLPSMSFARCFSDDFAFFFVNGIWTNDEDAEMARLALENAIGKDLSPGDGIRCGTQVTLAYNTSKGAADLYESARQKNLITDKQAIVFSLLLSGLIDASFNAPLASFFVEEAIDQVIDVDFSSPENQESVDIRTHLALYNEALANGKHIVIVAHSQGNLFANQEYASLLAEHGSTIASRITIVAVATPADSIPGADPSNPHVTVHGDFIDGVFGNPLPENAAAIPDRTCLFVWDCHNFVGSYLGNPVAHMAVLRLIKQPIIGTAQDDSYPMGLSRILTVPAPGVLSNDMIEVSVTDVVFSGAAGNPTFTALSGGGFRLDRSADPNFTELRFAYIVRTPIGDSNFATIAVTLVTPAPLNSPPVAGFSMSVPSHIAMSGGTLQVAADQSTGEARVTLTDGSTDLDGISDITGRRWTTSSGDPLSDGLTTFTWGFTPGVYTVILTVTDHGGQTGTASGTVEVAPAPLVPVISGLTNTGIGMEGLVDGHWILQSGPTCPAGNCNVYTTETDGFPLGQSWFANDQASKWVEPISGRVDGHPPGEYIYRLTFDLGGADPAKAVIAGRWSADDIGSDILINGVSTGFTTTTSSFNTFAISQGLHSGVNTLDFVANNAVCTGCGNTNPSGLRVEFFAGAGLPTLFFDEGASLAAFGEPVIDSTGALYLARTQGGFSCGFGFCGASLKKIVPGSPSGGWRTTDAEIGADTLAPLRLAVAPGNRIYFQTRNRLLAFEADGTKSSGLWPVEFAPFFNNRFVSSTLIDGPTGEVFAEAATFGACFNSCFQYIRGLRPDGSELWQKQFNAGATLNLGSNRDVYIGDGSQARMIRFDRESGIEVCRSTVHSISGWLGTPEGLFAANGASIRHFKGDCTNSQVFSANVSSYRLHGYAQGRVFGAEVSGSIVQLFGVTVDGQSIWRQGQIVPDTNPIRAIANDTLYVLGLDKTEGLLQKLFLVQATTGDILSRISLTGFCQSCGVAVAPDGTIYVNDLNSTRIYRVQ